MASDYQSLGLGKVWLLLLLEIGIVPLNLIVVVATCASEEECLKYMIHLVASTNTLRV